MAIISVPNQVINFDTVDPCNCFESNNVLYVDQTDQTQFQFDLTEVDGTNLITDPTFTAACGVNWDCSSNWTIAANKATFSAVGADNLTYDFGTLTLAKYYKIEITFTDTVAGVEVDVSLGGNDIVTGQVKVVDGTWTLYHYLVSSTNDDLVIQGNNGDFAVSNVSVTIMSMPTVLTDPAGYEFTFLGATYAATEPDIIGGPTITTIRDNSPVKAVISIRDTKAIIAINWGEITITDGCYSLLLRDRETSIDLTSIEFNIQDYTGLCTYKLQWTNNEDAFGFIFEDITLTQTMRIKGKLWKPRYPEEVENFTYSSGLTEVLYADSYKVKQLATQFLTEPMHDALRLGLIHDTFTIDGVEYVKEDSGYSPQWDRGPDAPVVVDVRLKEQKTTNSYCV